MGKYASKVIGQAKTWIGKKESNGSHKLIIDVYNAHKPLARGYKVKYTDNWCATFVSAVAIKCDYTDIIPTECSCEKMIDLCKKKGIWVENENRTPKSGEIIFYDWDDNGSGDNKGWSDHVGIVEKVSNGKITVIEGNYSNSVKRRTIAVNGKCIRGYAVPKYDKEQTSNKPDKKPYIKPSQSVKIESAKSFSKSVAGTYKTTSNLHLRSGAGTLKKSILVMPKGSEVKCYGYYTTVLGTKWLFIQYKDYTGFCSIKYLK